ncbi:MAG TPA: lipid A biosynthesis lauroyl acyltransferase [Xanthobacteraceae bacterium]|nr:lipid A biosynthesis lauroyl acyltransferase [Xanthobacteraceae bacterium]
MAFDVARLLRQAAVRLKRAGDAVIGRVTVWLLKAVRLIDPDVLAGFLAALMRTVGPWLPEHRLGRAQLAAAFPEKPPAEIERILSGVWDNLGRVAGEFARLDQLWDYDRARPDAGRILSTPEIDARFDAMRDDGKPALIFTAHLANWELPALAAHADGLDFAALYRRPNLSAAADAVVELRAGSMGTLIAGGPEAPFRLVRALAAGRHVGMLVDQHYGNGPEVTFFGRRCRVNPMLARLARHVDCPIYGTRAIRLPDRRLKVDLTGPIEVPRDPDGRVNVEGAMQAITTIVEGWVREHPEQWLWLHRRWR